MTNSDAPSSESIINGVHIEDGAILFEPRNVYDQCIIGYNQNDRCVVYSYAKIESCLFALFIDDFGTEYNADEIYGRIQDHISYNMMDSQGYDRWPIIFFEGNDDENA